MMTSAEDEHLFTAAAELLAAMSAEPMPPSILSLAAQLQAVLDEKRQSHPNDFADTSLDSF